MKNPLKSKTIWVNVAAVVLYFYFRDSEFGYDDFHMAAEAVIPLVWAVANVVVRFFTNTAMSIKAKL